MNVVLIGYRGTGKSRVASLVADARGMATYRTDDAVEHRLGCSIAAFVATHGWGRFRDVEEEVAREAGALDNAVIDTGGGIVLRPANVAALRQRGRVFWLTASVETIVGRIHACDRRPSLTGTKSITEEVEEVLEARTPLYRGAADHVVATDDRTPAEVARVVLDLFGTG